MNLDESNDGIILYTTCHDCGYAQGIGGELGLRCKKCGEFVFREHKEYFEDIKNDLNDSKCGV